MLPGYSQNAYIFAEQMATIKADLGDVELYFVDQPLVLNFDEAPGDLKRFDSTASFKSDDIRVLPRAFWSGRRDDDWTHFDGLQESISFFRELLEREKFDGVIGFSQGGTMATILTALCERPHAHPLWAAAPLPGRESYPWPPTPFKFCIVGSGFYAVHPSLRRLYEPTPIDSTAGTTQDGKVVKTPTLLIIGERDPVIPRDRSEVLARHHANIRIVSHDGGHYMPSKPSWRRFFREYVDSFRAGASGGGLDVVAPFRSESHDGVERRSGEAVALPSVAARL